MPKLPDPMATTVAERAIADLLEHLIDEDGCIDSDAAVRVLVDNFAAQLDTCHGQRRLILTGQWEVDPAAQVPSLMAAGQR